ncbi:MAG: dynamin family protein [Bernardetiaceae bacterium]|nr:dynamin family protein [Bernardetiaceae bacterium]
MAAIIDKKLRTIRLRLDEIAKSLHQLTVDIETDELARTLSDLRQRINEPFMFVVVGEVKAGKSSFVNALLESKEDICKVAPDPCTDTVQQILYGEEKEIIQINPHLKKILIPVPILKEIAIVDTPGTNTISEKHQQITEEFIPASDLIVFVFEAKNPYRQSAWDFFDFIHTEWRKKIIFVLQQSDLMNEQDLQINIEGLRKHTEKKGMLEAQIFAVSAKLEQEAKHDESGFFAVRRYIQMHITGGKAPILKLKNNIDISKNILQKIKEGVALRAQQLEADTAFRKEISRTLKSQEKKAHYQIDVLIENLLSSYELITQNTEVEIKQGLGAFTLLGNAFKSLFSDKESVKQWFDKVAADLDNNLRRTLGQKIEEGVVALADTIQQMAKMIDMQLRQSPKILKENHEIFGNIADRRSAVLQELQLEMSNFTSRHENFTDTSQIVSADSNFSPQIAASGGIAVIGVAIAALTQGAVLDITGGIMTAAGVIFAGVTIYSKRQKILNAYRKEIIEAKQNMREEIEDRLQKYVLEVKTKIEANFKDFDMLLEMEDSEIQSLLERCENLRQQLDKSDEQLTQASL